jgi:hypothetical protein
MPYVPCTECGLTSYTPPPAVLAAECPECGARLLEPRAATGAEHAPSLSGDSLRTLTPDTQSSHIRS